MKTKDKKNAAAIEAIKALPTEDIITNFGQNSKNTGSTAVQVALLTKRILLLTEHLQMHKKDHHTRRGLLRLVGQRRRLLNYLFRTDVDQYRSLIKRLGIRK